jgi:uncharacterized protein YecE (DUF72 family)
VGLKNIAEGDQGPPVVGTAGWAIPRAVADRFPADGSGLQRYAARFTGVEINSTFYRSHRAQTYARWRERTPSQFRFCVKLPRAITHEAKLQACDGKVEDFLAEVEGLGEKLGPLLVQLAPSLAFDAKVAERFFGVLRASFVGSLVCEPRHPSWFDAEADALLISLRIARAAADPAPLPLAALPGGWRGLAYWRLHGSPRMYFSPYDESRLRTLAAALVATPAEQRWCIFDNTTSGAAAENAMTLSAMLRTSRGV